MLALHIPGQAARSALFIRRVSNRSIQTYVAKLRCFTGITPKHPNTHETLAFSPCSRYAHSCDGRGFLLYGPFKNTHTLTPSAMPTTHTVSIYAGRSFDAGDLDGLTWSDHHDAYLLDDDAVNTDADGFVHSDEVCTCDRCGTALSHEDNDERIEVVDVGERWCEGCVENHAAWVDREDAYYADPPSEGLAGYHNGDRSMGNATAENPYRIGFEVEKEDEGYLDRLTAEDISLPRGWLAEEDGSLNEYGFELVSPAYNLTEGERMAADFKTLSGILDADSSKRCGGHISISDIRYTPTELSDRLKPLFPLLMALYPARLKSCYSAPIKAKDKGQGRRAFSCGGDRAGERVELRIFPQVKSADQLRWRADLVTLFLNAAKDGPLGWRWMRTALCSTSPLYAHLLKGYAHLGDQAPEKVKSVLTLYRAFSGWYFTERPVADTVAEYVKEYPNY